jgi:hypothetical protein
MTIMLLLSTIPKAPSADPGLDQPQLFARGLEQVRRLAWRLWTDHNVHDPGITILELLSYALTDVAYRAAFPIEDLLATSSDPEENAAAMAGQFFTPKQILPNRALTVLDYRKLLIDLPGVKNAWVLPAEQTYFADTHEGKLLRERVARPGIREVEVRGLYRALLDFMDGLGPAEKDDVRARALRLLQSNRNLCEDFVRVDGVETQDFVLCAELELAPDADTARVQAEILFQVGRWLDPPVHNYSLDEMLELPWSDGSRRTAEEIFDGPLLAHGFIDEEDLARAELRTAIHLSDVIRLLMNVEGVRAVREIVINPKGTTAPLADKWRVVVTPGKRPALKDSRLVLYKRNMPVVPPAAAVAEHFARLEAAERSKLEEGTAGDLPIPLGRYRQPARYTSFQNDFPALYGLSEVGPPAGADVRRQALALQLKGYLLLFDQVMANACAQLGALPALFSTDPDLAHTYFSQVVDSFKDFEQIYPANLTAVGRARMLTQVTEDAATVAERRNRFLDHLTARFAERFHDYVAIMLSAFGAGAASVAEVKCAFLRDYPALGAGRGIAWDAGRGEPADLWDSANVSGLERRLGRLLGLANIDRRSLSAVPLGADAEVDGTNADGFRFRLRHRATAKILLSNNTTFATAELARKELARVLELAPLDSAYERKTTVDGKHFFNLVDGKGTLIARRFEFFAAPAQRDAAIDELIAYARRFYSGEGMFLIENLLLRPGGPDEPFLPICVDPNCADCADDDPYSYRLHVVLPAYAGRFVNMDFRRFAEEVIREETPAHLLPKICWISRDDMARLEAAYHDGLEGRAGADAAARREKLVALIAALFAVKNVYPAHQLHPCDSPEDQPKFILGRTALGSGENEKA